jgi:ArsR family transcriptional regulator
VTRVLEIGDRQLGERCCDVGARPSRTYGEAESTASAFDILAHPVRLQLLDVLARNEGRVCVCDLEAAVPVKQPTVSHHLRLLREAGLVESEKVGQWVYYRIRREPARELRDRAQQVLATLAG